MEAVIKEIMELVNTVQKNRVCAEMSPSNKDHFNGLAQEASTTIVARLHAALQCQGCEVPKDGVYQISEPSHSMSMYASKDDMLKAVMAENEQLKAQLAEPHPLHQHLLHMLGAKSHEEAGGIIAKLHACQLAAAQQGVQPESKAIAEIVSASHDEAEFGERAVHFLRDFNHLEYGTKLYAHPTKQGVAEDGMYYLQDARWSAMVGNCPSFWREGGNGYTTNLDEAGRFTFEDAMAQHRCRETDLPWLCAEVDKLRHPTIDCQYMPRSWDEQRAAIAAQAKQGEQQ